MVLSLKVFIVFHKAFFPENYLIHEEHKNYLTFYAVKDEQETTMDVIYEKYLPIYEPVWQQLCYNEGSALYHVYKNNIHRQSNFVGFFQYDMTVHNDCFDIVESSLKKNHRTIFYYEFFPWAFLGGQTTITTDYSCLESGLKNYNKFFNTDFTEEQLVFFKMPICNTFVIHSSIFEKMMDWMSQYFIRNIQSSMQAQDGIVFNPGHMIEALTSMFLCLEVVQGAEYKKLSISHDQNLKLK